MQLTSASAASTTALPRDAQSADAASAAGTASDPRFASTR